LKCLSRDECKIEVQFFEVNIWAVTYTKPRPEGEVDANADGEGK
jgi:hypothetical protein